MKQERWKSIFKPLTILPVIVMLCTIFGFSNQNGTTSGGLSQKVSRQIVTVCDTLFHQDLAEETIEHYTEKIEYPLRKAAHATEYLILTLLAALPLYTYGLRGKKPAFGSIFILCHLRIRGRIPPVLYSRQVSPDYRCICRQHRNPDRMRHHIPCIT